MKKFIKILKSIKLSEKEKGILRYRIEQFISFNPIRNEVYVPKRIFYFSIFSLRSLSKGISLVLIILIVVGGTSITYASNDALPGDALYPIKINIKENIEEKLALTTNAKIEIQSVKIERRLDEAQKLTKSNSLSPEKKEIVKAGLEKNVEKVTKTIEGLKEGGNIEKALDVTSKITPVLEAHKEALIEKNDGETDDDGVRESLLKSVDEAIKKVEDAEVGVIEKVIEHQKISEEVTAKNTEEVNQKIDTIKKISSDNVITLEAEKTKSEASMSAEETDATTLAPEVSISQEKMIVVAEPLHTSTSSTASLKTTHSYNIEIKNEIDINIKIKEAEELLKNAEDQKNMGNYKEALILSQKAKKIIAQIEIYKKIKSEDKKQDIKLEETKNKEIKSSAETTGEVPLLDQAKENILPNIQKEIKESDLKAEVIKSIKETNDSIKEIKS